MDPTSANLLVSHQETFRQLIQELKNPGLDQTRHAEILAQMNQIIIKGWVLLVTIYESDFHSEG